MGIARLAWCFVPILLAVVFISFVEEKMNGWFAPFTGASPVTASPTARAASTAPVALVGRAVEPTGPLLDRFKVVVDPGHGGRSERRSSVSGDNWDADLGEFLAPYLGGGARTIGGTLFSEQEIALQLARRVKLLLDRTTNDRAWPQFEKTIRGYLEISKSPIRRVHIECALGRDSSYLDHPEATRPNSNRFFRLFDSPEELPAKPGGRLWPGRMSTIVAGAPDLVLCLHVNDSAVQAVCGATALFVPPYELFDEMRRMVVGSKPWKDLRANPYYLYWTATRAGRNRRDEIASEVTRYFLDTGTGSGGRKTRPGSRRRHVTWRYRDDAPSVGATLQSTFTGPYWEREQSRFEAHRRAGGPEEIGGDNLYAGQELIRFLRYALWKDRLEKGLRMSPEIQRFHLGFRPRKSSRDEPDEPARSPSPSPSPGAAPESMEASTSATAASTGPMLVVTAAGPARPAPASGLDEYLGRHWSPIASDWALPLFCNSVTAYLEVAYLSNPADQWLLENKLDVMAEGLAVGTYALLAGLRVKPLPALGAPRGTRIDWERYQTTPWGARYVDVARQVTATKR